MAATTLIFYPHLYIGFNKTQLIERQLAAAGIIGSKINASPTFSAGPDFRQFIPKVDALRKSYRSTTCTRIQSVGVWTTDGTTGGIFERTNVVIVEGDAIGPSPDHYAAMRELLGRITDDCYLVAIAEAPLCSPIAELRPLYG